MTKFKRHAQSQPKHGPPPASGASKAPVAPPVRRPGWTGPSYIRKVVKKTPAAVKQDSSIEQIQILSVKHQQLILDTIRTAFPAVDEFSALTPVLRSVREALEQQDYGKAFGTEEFLEAYTIRWSPSRALTTANVLAWMCSAMSETAWVQEFLHNDREKPSKILCIGRGGSDLLACATLLKHSHQSKVDQVPYEGSAMVDLSLIDRHDWSGVVTKLQHTLTHAPPLSKYATAKAHAANVPAIPSQLLNLAVNQLDILEGEGTDLPVMIGPNPALITLFFTLHELYSVSISKTTAFLLRLTSAAPKGSLLLVVDSPEADVALPDSSNKGQEKRYPVEWLLYQALLPAKGRDSEKEEEHQPAWTKLVQGGHEKEYKLPTELRYPGSLENTRLQVHLLERL
ncbi:hypothetical protein FPOAC2_10471 [Fusarium poae]|jgi:25S rRNA (uracil2843-N3)-methyltransferase|uniref:25S rRNA (Uridine(2843)-N(3))-methyltransferase n=1 Tax=Fusarium poae TaxID=36050 RepID=A0A1B8AB50_FUSPO|nr:hypothetical protein FPOAC1_010193 [Fusarium poae]KAG8665398.1 hypothetical protein FPOAC1_010193 [Fusarium poae]OBS17698.1 hypothetical protein FPOA_09431 [Fusarium poae]